MNRVARWLATFGGAVLAVTAAYHATGLGGVRAAVEASSLSEPLAGVISGLWLFFSWHLAVVAAAAFLVSVRSPGWARWPLVFCGLVTLFDFFLVLQMSGWFAGTLLLLVAAASLLIAGYLAVERPS